MMKAQIKIEGECGDTEVELELTFSDSEFLFRLCEAINEAAKTLCQPTMSLIISDN